jgi:hypothetical protein
MRQARVFGTLFFSVFTLTGGSIASCGVVQIQEGSAMQSWTRGDATVLTSQVRRQKHTDLDYLVADVSYRYSADGREFTNDRIQLGAAIRGTVTELETVINRYPVGATVDVYYDPDSPASAVLERAVPSSSRVLLGIGGLFGLFGVGGTVIVWRARSNTNAGRS